MTSPADVDADAARSIAEALVARHAALERSIERHPDASVLVRAVGDAVLALEKSAPELAGEALQETARELVRFLETHADALLERAADGRVLAQALDLRLADVRLERGGAASVVPHTSARGAPGDVCEELAGLSVDLLRAGLVEPAERLVSHYAGEAGDFDLYHVVDLYERKCALARAARAADPAGPAGRDEARALVGLVCARGRRPLVPALVVAFGGGVASGKSTLARALADRMALPRVVADRIRDQQLHGVPGDEIHETGWDEVFDAGFQERVYAELLRGADCALDSGRGVVLDGCFARARDRAAARSLARRHGVPFHFVECRVAPEVRNARLTARDAASEGGGWSDIARALEARWEPADDLAEGERTVVDAERPPAENAELLAARLPAWPEEGRP